MERPEQQQVSHNFTHASSLDYYKNFLLLFCFPAQTGTDLVKESDTSQR
jgi:hypothetical protein